MFVKFLVLLKWVQARVFINGHSITFDMKKKHLKSNLQNLEIICLVATIFWERSLLHQDKNRYYR